MTVLAERPRTVFRGTVPQVAGAPAEQRGLTRDGVRLLVARPSGMTHTRFTHLVEHLDPGDVLIVNTSATVNGELDGTLESSTGARPVVVHLATVIIGILAAFVGGLLLGLFAYRNASGGIPWLGWLVGAIFAAIGITIYGRMRGSRA